jgi:AraC-like DNA-binding protein
MSDFLHLDTIAAICPLFKQKESSRHPLVTVVDFSTVSDHVAEATKVSGDFYSILFKNYAKNNIKYGRQPLDFHNGSLICMAPNQVIELDEDTEYEIKPDMLGWGLFFHPDLVRSLPMKDYSFFSYEVSEALHLSEKEKQTLYDCVIKIGEELQENVDVHSERIIVSNIELLLNYCTRFYGRQFITRKSSNHSVVAQVEQLLRDYFQRDEKGLPSVKYLAEQVHLSPGYLSDLLKKETGKNTQDHIHFHLIEEAKNILLNTNKTVNEIAYDLGFEYPQYFNKLFKQKTGKTPAEFRNSW